MMLCRLFGLLVAVVLVVEVPAQLPPDIQADRYLVEAERHIETGDQAAAQAALDRILALQAAHDLVLPEAFWFQYAEVAYQAGLYGAAEEAATRYLTTVGREGEHYQAALALLDRAAADRQRVEAEMADEAAYAEAQHDDTAAAYSAYLAAYPTGRHAAEARTRQQERTKTEWLARLPREVRNSIGIEFVLIEPGTFEMGSPSGEPGRDDDETQHRVTLSQPFYLGKYEVTQEQWEAVMGTNPSRFSNCGRTCPVERVSWEDIQGFIAKLNLQEGVSVYRLPTEAEREYAARAGTQTAYYFGNVADRLGPYGWYMGNSDNRTHPVGQKQPNGWGLYDMHGNVWEWVADWYGAYSRGAVTDPHGPRTGTDRVYRGGSRRYPALSCRASNRSGDSPGSRNNHFDTFGFRLARTP